MTVRIRSDLFKEAMGRFATGVAVVTTVGPNGDRVGFTANAVASVSLDPLLLLVSVDQSSSSLDPLLETGFFALSFLHADDLEVAHRFATGERDTRFDGLEVRSEVTGAPILESALAWVDCTVWKVVEAGDHHVVFGEVQGCGVSSEGAPLLYFRGGFGTMSP
jgi:flavin reductase (DIM6/NTAB) family NADH-FMN oxidoreductase RutF